MHSPFSEWEESTETYGNHWLSMDLSAIWTELCILMALVTSVGIN